MDAAAATLPRGFIDDVAARAEAAGQGEIRASVGSAATAPQRLREPWTELASSASEANSFAESWFGAASLRHLDLPHDLKLIEVWHGAALIGLLPVHPTKGYARLPIRHVVNWTHFHCFLGTPLIRAGSERSFWKAALELLDTQAWAGNLLYLTGLVENGPVHRGLIAAARELGRPCDTVHRSCRALLETSLAPEPYYERTVRKKKRKELKRLSTRLSELGTVETRSLATGDELEPWCEAFLKLERSGWKGDRGSALGCDPGTATFFREAVEGAFHSGKLDFLRLDLDGQPLAMLVNFIAAPGSFSFKIAIDESYARFSPGVLIQIENLRILERPDVAWTDSCAAEDHPMINSLWGERRQLVRVSVPLAGSLRGAIFRLCRSAERASAAFRSLGRKTKNNQGNDDE